MQVGEGFWGVAQLSAVQELPRNLSVDNLDFDDENCNFFEDDCDHDFDGHQNPISFVSVAEADYPTMSFFVC